ncbi:MAG: DEAD/DEAH box helicase, partial [Bacteroidaceae bacterium]
MSFKDLSLIPQLLKAISDVGYTDPTPIQAAAIPIVLSGTDLLGCAQTGTGKTAAFALPILQKLQNTNQRDGIKALIVTPTRELAIQIDECFTQYGTYLHVRHTVIFGGVNDKPQIATLRQGVQILIATPGRLLDLQGQGCINLKKLDFFVLDEADRMLDMGFIHDIRKILSLIPEKRQTLFFSATMPDPIAKLSQKILSNPRRVEVTPATSTAENVEQYLYFVSKSDKIKLLLHLLKDETMESVLVFTRTKHGADKIVKLLSKENITSAAIHGNKSQNARQRALSGFKEHKIRVLIATDIAARGIDIDRLSHVVNYELPNEPETYIHRIGRTGRAGNEGIALSFCDTEECA